MKTMKNILHSLHSVQKPTKRKQGRYHVHLTISLSGNNSGKECLGKTEFVLLSGCVLGLCLLWKGVWYHLIGFLLNVSPYRCYYCMWSSTSCMATSSPNPCSVAVRTMASFNTPFRILISLIRNIELSLFYRELTGRWGVFLICVLFCFVPTSVLPNFNM